MDALLDIRGLRIEARAFPVTTKPSHESCGSACAPLMMSRNATPVDCIFGLAKRFTASTKLCAVTALPFENLKPGLMVNV